MGEIVEMMLDGTLCQSCGEALIHGPEDEPAGYPQYCAGCQPDDDDQISYDELMDQGGYASECPICKKRFRADAHMKQHQRDKHGVPD